MSKFTLDISFKDLQGIPQNTEIFAGFDDERLRLSILVQDSPTIAIFLSPREARMLGSFLMGVVNDHAPWKN